MYIRNTLHVPNRYNSIVIRRKKIETDIIILYNQTKQITIPMSEDRSLWSFDHENKSIISVGDIINYKWNKIINTLNHKMFTFENMFFEKITFKGKGFKLISKKKTNFLHFFFGHSHIKVIFLKKARMKRLSKYKYYFKSKLDQKLKQSARLISNIRPLNIFTKRGLRRNRQVVFKRKGKKSTYV